MPTSPEMPAIIKRRRPRFERVQNLSFQLTDRDCEITLFVGMGRFRSSRQIRAMFGGSYHLLHRLQALYHASILDRPQAQKEIFVKGGGSGSHIYALAPKGARLLNERYGTQFPDIDWLHAHCEVGRPHILHVLGIGDLDVAVRSAVRSTTDIELIDAKTLIEDFKTPPSSPQAPFMWQPTIRRDDKTIVVPANPDFAFALGSPTVDRYYYLCEIDRGTMPVMRANYERTSIVRKLDVVIVSLIGAGLKLDRVIGWRSWALT